MKKLIVFYSYSGKTKNKAKVLASKEGSDLLEVKDESRPGVIKAYTLGSRAAIKGRIWPIFPLSKNMDDYDEITLMAPVWAGYPAPAMWNVMNQLPLGKNIRVIMVSGSGRSKCRQTVETQIKRSACRLLTFEDCQG